MAGDFDNGIVIGDVTIELDDRDVDIDVTSREMSRVAPSRAKASVGARFAQRAALRSAA
jgi:hypothetical protein